MQKLLVFKSNDYPILLKKLSNNIWDFPLKDQPSKSRNFLQVL